MNSKQEISIYIHWPYCLALCPYCDFNSHLNNNIDHKTMTGAYLKQLEYFQPNLQNKTIKSIFFGGGTPSLMLPGNIEIILNKIANIANLADNVEITLEANPTSFETKKFIDFKKVGINRVSIGVQSFNQDELKFLGREHSSQDAIESICSASKIFDNYSFDLIYALPKQTLESWKKTLEYALSLTSKHISLYQLTIEKGTKFYSMYHHQKLFNLPNDDYAFKMYQMTNNMLEAQGLINYEISNYAKKYMESIHNLTYWHYGEYLGIGPGAYSRLHNINLNLHNVTEIIMHHNPQKWLSEIANNKSAIQKTNNLTNQIISQEIIMMGLRLKSGISDDHLFHLTGNKFIDILNINKLEILKQYELLNYNKDITHITLTNKGMLLHSQILKEILL